MFVFDCALCLPRASLNLLLLLTFYFSYRITTCCTAGVNFPTASLDTMRSGRNSLIFQLERCELECQRGKIQTVLTVRPHFCEDLQGSRQTEVERTLTSSPVLAGH